MQYTQFKMFMTTVIVVTKHLEIPYNQSGYDPARASQKLNWLFHPTNHWRFIVSGQNKTTEEICTIVNNLEYVRRSLSEYDDEHM